MRGLVGRVRGLEIEAPVAVLAVSRIHRAALLDEVRGHDAQTLEPVAGQEAGQEQQAVSLVGLALLGLQDPHAFESSASRPVRAGAKRERPGT